MNPFEIVGVIGHLTEQMKTVDVPTLVNEIKDVIEQVKEMAASQRRTEAAVKRIEAMLAADPYLTPVEGQLAAVR